MEMSLLRKPDGSLPDISAEDWERFFAEHPEALETSVCDGGGKIITSWDYKDRSGRCQGKRFEPVE
jgi:hypothetical protein